MARFEEEDGIDAPFERAMDSAIRDDVKPKRYRVMRRHLGGLVDVAHPLQPDTDGCYVHGKSRKEALQNLRALGKGAVGLVFLEVDENDRVKGAA